MRRQRLGRSLLAAGLFVGGTLWTAAGGAQPTSAAAPTQGVGPAQAGAVADPCACRRPRSTIDGTTRSVASGLGPLPRQTVVVASSLRSDTPAPRAKQLVVSLARHVAGSIGPAAAAHDQPLDLSAARRAASKARALVWLRAEIAAGQLRLRADAYPIPRSVWARARCRAPGPVAHAHAQGSIDAEIRGFLEPVRFDAPVVKKYTGADPTVVAIACGHLDQDGAPDLVTVSRSRVMTIRLRDGRVERLREARWSELVPVAPVPLREPLGLATIVAAAPGGEHASYLDIALTDRARSVRFDESLNVTQQLEGLAVPTGAATACAGLHNMMVDRGLTPCHRTDPPPNPAALRHRCDALSSVVVIDPQGRPHIATALRSRSALVLRLDDGPDQNLGPVGAQIAVGDVDQDGKVDIASSLDVLDASRDVLLLRTLQSNGQLEQRYRLPAPTGIRAVAICPPDGPGRSAIVLVAGEQLWVVR